MEYYATVKQYTSKCSMVAISRGRVANRKIHTHTRTHTHTHTHSLSLSLSLSLSRLHWQWWMLLKKRMEYWGQGNRKRLTFLCTLYCII